jgi:hypothetical protein
MRIYLKYLFVLILFAGCRSQLDYSKVEIFPFESYIQNIENYNTEEFEILNEIDNLKISGTLISPKNEFDKLVIIVAGTGANTRNSQFKLAESLLKNNIAVFRYDDRGVNKSEGDYVKVWYTASNMENEMLSATNFLKRKFNNKKIGLIGHSMGGMATIGAFEKGAPADFLIQLSTPVMKNGEDLKYQLKSGLNSYDKGLNYETDEEKLKVMDLIHQTIVKNKELDVVSMNKKIGEELKFNGYNQKDSWRYYVHDVFQDMVKKDYEPIYKNSKIPILYIIGSNDKYVDPINNLSTLRGLNNKNITIKEFEGYNHLLRKGEVKMDETAYLINDDVIEFILEWMK